MCCGTTQEVQRPEPADRGMIMIRKRTLAVCLGLLTAMLSACGQVKGPDTIDKPTLVITETGKVTAYLVGELDKAYYELAELEAMALEEAAEFNRLHPLDGGEMVTLESVEALEEGGTGVVVSFGFENAQAYTEYTGQPLFFGSPEEGLKEAGDGLPVLKNVKDGTEATQESLMAQGGKLIAVGAGTVVYCPYRVTHVSQGAVLNADGSVDALGAEGTVYILMR